MEIRNNTPMYSRQSFGMAYKAPDADDMSKLIDKLLEHGMSASEAKRALVNLRKKHAGDAHFDWQFVADTANGYRVTPKTNEAIGLYGSKPFVFGVNVDSLKFYNRGARLNERCEKRLADAKGLKYAWAKVRNFFDRCGYAIDRISDPTTVLPADMRYASAQVSSAEARVNKKIADKATISSAFDVVIDDVAKKGAKAVEK